MQNKGTMLRVSYKTTARLKKLWSNADDTYDKIINKLIDRCGDDI